jgi:hypothetical protein
MLFGHEVVRNTQKNHHGLVVDLTFRKKNRLKSYFRQNRFKINNYRMFREEDVK